MADNDTEFNGENDATTKKKSGNLILFIILACWLTFYLFVGSRGGPS